MPTSLKAGDSVYLLSNCGVGCVIHCYLHGRFIGYASERNYLRVELWNQWWHRWEEQVLHRRKVRISRPPKLYQEILQGAYKHTFLEPKYWPADAGVPELDGTIIPLEMMIKGELLVFYQLIDAVRAAIKGVRSKHQLTVRLADEPANGNALYFEHGQRYARVTAILTGKNDYLLQVRYLHEGRIAETPTPWADGEGLQVVVRLIQSILFTQPTG